MKKLALLTIPLVAGFLCMAQERESQSSTTTQTTTWNGTLVDAGCQASHHERSESTTTTPNQQTTTKSEKHETSDCPITTSTTSFGMMTSDGRFVRFDDAGNTRVVEMVKSNKDWNRYMNEHQPIRVRVVGAPNGDVIVIREIR